MVQTDRQTDRQTNGHGAFTNSSQRGQVGEKNNLVNFLLNENKQIKFNLIFAKLNLHMDETVLCQDNLGCFRFPKKIQKLVLD